MLIWLFILFYVLPAFLHWYSVRLQHKTIYKGVSPWLLDVVATFIPVVNAVWGIMNLIQVWSYVVRKREGDYRKFFMLDE